MKILQTIWTALTTENELLIKITSMPMLILELTVSMLLFTTLLNIKSSKKQKIIYISILSIIGFINLWFVPTPFNTFVNILANAVSVYFIFKTNILKSILSVIIPYILFVVIGALILNLGVNLLKIPSDVFLKILLAKVLCSSLIYIIAYFIYKICYHYNINITIIENFKIRNKLTLIISIIIGIFCIAIQSYLLTIYSHFLPIPIAIINLVLLLIYFSFNIFSLLRTNKLESTTQNLEEEKLYNKTLTILYDNIRGFRHNFNNTLQAIGGYISTDDMEGLKTYYNDLLNDSQTVNNLAILNPELINNPAIYSTLTSKYYEAERHGIKMNLEILLDLKTLNVKIYDLTTILGILLDNAIEASSKCDQKEINVIIRKDNKSNKQLFIIENTYTNKDVDTYRIFEKGYTSKQDEDAESHGLGLWNVRQILKRNNNLNLFTTKTDKLFKQQLEIYC